MTDQDLLGKTTATAAASRELAWHMPRSLVTPWDDSPDHDVYAFTRAQRAGAIVTAGVDSKRVLSSFLEQGPTFISSPSGRGKSTLHDLLAREVETRRSIVWLSGVNMTPDILESIQRQHEDAQWSRDGLMRALDESRAIVAIDDWDRCAPELRQALAKTPQRFSGCSFLFLGSPAIAPPLCAAARHLRLLPFTPGECSQFLSRRLMYPASTIADELARRLSPLSREAFFLSIIAEYFASGLPRTDMDMLGVISSLVGSQLSARLANSKVLNYSSCAASIAASGARFDLQCVAEHAARLGMVVDPGEFTAVLCEVGVVIGPRRHGEFEFAHGLWQAALVASLYVSGRRPPEHAAQLSDPTLRCALARLIPIQDLHTESRDRLLRNYAATDLASYLSAVGAAERVPAHRTVDGGLRELLAGIQDVTSLVSTAARSTLEPWASYDDAEQSNELGALSDARMFVLRLRRSGEPVIIPVTDAREPTSYDAPIGTARAMGLSRRAGADLVLSQLQTLWEHHALPDLSPLAREQLVEWCRELSEIQELTTLDEVVTFARAHHDDLLLSDGGIVQNGGYQARWHRLERLSRARGISGAELLSLATSCAVTGTTRIEGLRHPGPDCSVPGTQFRDQYSPDQNHSFGRRERLVARGERGSCSCRE